MAVTGLISNDSDSAKFGVMLRNPFIFFLELLN